MSTTIPPTIGRVVLFYPSKQSDAPVPEQPFPALVCYVHGLSCINVGGFNASGTPFSACSVLLIQDGDPIPDTGYYACWMPYQIGQAAKVAAMQDAQVPQAGLATNAAASEPVDMSQVDQKV